MALPLAPGLTPNEEGFLAEMELVTVIPRQKLERLELLGGPTQPLNPPFPASLPLWLALLLKRQKRCNISPPAWLSVDALTSILDMEKDELTAAVFSPSPNLPPPKGNALLEDPYLWSESLETSSPYLADSATTRAQPDALPYHWLEISHLLLTHAADDFVAPDEVRTLVRDLREIRMSKLRKGFKVLGPEAGVKMNGVGGMEIAEVRGFVGGVIDGLRKINRPREEARREREAEARSGGLRSSGYTDDDDDEMQL
ncbi:GINS complex, PSF2 component [Dissoconium aciculare CBS 342.82]|uniref:DNA replication complex GINS protein PSF2 n=1 Tax=Dissoconium aciculare CBS 342.82 TaxID=1314786 RepID=A0A6J3LWX5_9PEZI|nr:GINS complex, PSF2 component [Dissoconium aciculare CBS 342.82]KAF1820256.1 GINS complex, PSF2 component [Dissoconium aciculare CBS 342.82]